MVKSGHRAVLDGDERAAKSDDIDGIAVAASTRCQLWALTLFSAARRRKCVLVCAGNWAVKLLL
jgi:hypothetical protein